MIKNVFFDLDDTIFDYAASEIVALSTALKKAGIEPTEEVLKSYHGINIPLWQAYERKEASCEFIVIERFRQLFEKNNINFDAQKMEDIYEAELGQNAHLIEDARETLKELKKTCRIYAASNGLVKIQESRLRISDTAKYFDDVFTSERNGACKPNKEFFEYCFERIPNFKKEETVIVGDSMTSDIKGGINAGIRTIWFNRFKMPKVQGIVPDYEFRSLEEIKEFIQSENSVKS